MKKERNLLKLLTDEECVVASSEALTNAEIHIQSAKAIAMKEYYGNSVSHLVLSTEELIKALLLQVQHLGLNIRNQSGIHLFFTDHIIKHRLATYFSVIYPMMNLFMGYVTKTKDKLHNPQSVVEYTDDEKAFMTQDKSRILNIFKDLEGMLDWWDDANLKKNKGFYIDYSKKLETPMQVTKDEFEQALKIAITFQNQIVATIGQFKKLTPEERKGLLKYPQKFDVCKIIAPIIEARRDEIRNKDKDPLERATEFLNKIKKGVKTTDIN